MDEKRKTAWNAAIKKLRQTEEVLPPEEHDALFQEGMFKGDIKHDIRIREEAVLFVRYLMHGYYIDPLPWFGDIIAHAWFHARDWDREWGSNRADKLLQKCIAADDFDHWVALNLIAARLHRERGPFPDTLADWAADVHARLKAGTQKPPAKERANEGQPPYAYEERNNAYLMANDWLEHYGMDSAEDRISVIAEGIEGVDDAKTEDVVKTKDVIRKGLGRARKPNWRRAPWPGE